ncbi:hypothetical protein BD324DRAFT_618212 [Kockovaella imperatae]|uniref:Pericentrin/AKAP-450 centrosomal targeting domain-containing protein n=1 Tax=Kockovaella imperatae TaxID=4999 RepID=A0A1Y1ULU8_9TREE|nr:hypothetical protein BD324DRAFT_618212 [Kockovaella imperatae]ORX39013.1 hypothetical protein BD324DRAFT_618212 [Kockovaella imperatae]
MATAYPMDTPSRVLRRVQQMEDVELPSLPSIEHGLDDGMTSEEEEDESDKSTEMQSPALKKSSNESDMATPHPLRQSYIPRLAKSSPADTTPTDVSSSGSPFPPQRQNSATPSPYAVSAPGTSTPVTLQSRPSRPNLAQAAQGSNEMERTQSARSLKSSTGTTRDKWHTPGEMSRSFSGEQISPESSFEGTEMEDEKSVPLNDTSVMSRDSEFHRPLTETPYTRRLSNGHVLHQRPGKRVSNMPRPTISGQNPGALSPISSSAGTASTPQSNQTALHIPAARIPSLTHSDHSATDVSEPTGTPEGPSREITVMSTPRLARDASQNYDDSIESGGSATELHDSELPSLPSLPAPEDMSQSVAPTPSKSVISDIMSTPGMGRLQSPRHMSPFSKQHTPYAAPLTDVTMSNKQSPASLPYTPGSVGSRGSKGSDFSTPRALLDDAERRKNHVIAVLSSTEMPSRRLAVRGTPHPLRRVSNASPASFADGSPAMPGQPSSFRATSQEPHSGDFNRTQANESFVSVASSADLTTDHRASRTNGPLVRANTSFPTILLPTGRNASSGSLRNLSESRADGVKIHRHLNAMNKQLLETNAGLAREAEAWRDEVDRLIGILRDAGIDFEEVDVLANLSAQMDQANHSRQDMLSERFRDRRDNSDINGSLELPRDGSSLQAQHEDVPPMSDLLATRMSLVDEKRSNDETFPAGALLEGLSDADFDFVVTEVVERLDLLEDHLIQKTGQIKDLQRELDVAHGFGSSEGNTTAVNQKVDELSQKLEEANQERAELQASYARKTEEHAKKFGEICSGFEEQVSGLEKELSAAKLEADRLRSEASKLEKLQSRASQGEREAELKKQLGEINVELRLATEASQARAAEVEDLKQTSLVASKERAELDHRMESIQKELAETLAQLRSAEQELGKARAEALSEQAQPSPASEGEGDPEKTRDLESINAQLEEELEQQDKEIQNLNDKLATLQADLDAMSDAKENAENLQNDVEHLNRMLDEAEENLAEKEAELESLRGKTSLSQSLNSVGPQQSDKIAEMEQQLEDAFKEIGRLKHELGSASHRKAVLDMKDMRIQSLEKEKALLQGRLASARDTSVGLKAAGSPFKATPLARKSFSTKALTPGPMMEMSWLQTTIGDANESVLLAQMEYLQKELDVANGHLDANFSRLEAAGLNGLNLAERLASAQDRIAELEAELRAMRVKSKTSDAEHMLDKDEKAIMEARLKAALKSVNEQLAAAKADYDAEQERLHNDNARLRDFITEVRAKSDAKYDRVLADMERLQSDTEATITRLTLEKAKVEGDLESVQRELRLSASKIQRLEREMQQRLEARDGHDAADSIQIQELEKKLRELRVKVRSLELSLDDRTEALRTAEERIASMRREKQSTADELALFENDLRAQRIENERFGVELRRLQAAQKQSDPNVEAELAACQRDLDTARRGRDHCEQLLKEARQDCSDLELWKTSHQCNSGLEIALADQRTRFKAQHKELAAQVKYLKAKFTREATFRNALSLQKRYLLLLVGGYSLNEQAILKQIASMGYPIPDMPRPRRTLKAVGIAVLGAIRARNSAQDWRRERKLKDEAVNSYHERKLELL